MIFQITPEQIAELNDADLRELVGKLAEQEVRQQGQSTSAVLYGGDQRAADGGLDVVVELQPDVVVEGYVPRYNTGYQVKAEDMPKSKILAEMRPNNVLRSCIRTLGAANGAYIIVSSRGSVSKSALDKRRNAMAQAISDCDDAAALHLDFFDRQRLATWVNQHPGLIPWVQARTTGSIEGWQPYQDWSSSPESSDSIYILDDQVRLKGQQIGIGQDQKGINASDGIQYLRQSLSAQQGIVRLVGLSGLGKTRLVQALFDDRIGNDALNPNDAIYTDTGHSPRPIPLELLKQLIKINQSAVLIVDNCGIELHRKLSTEIKKSVAQISLITIEYDITDDLPEHTDVVRLEPASPETIEGIVKRHYPQLTSPELRTIADFSEGNSRVALALASTAQQGTSLANLNDSDLFDRLFRQKHEQNPELRKAAEVCALVYSFDGETIEGAEAELPILAAIADIPVNALYAHIAELARRQLVQKRSKWRAILPHALAHRLAKVALENRPIQSIDKVLASKETPVRLIKSFSRRLGYLHDAQEVVALVENWLKEDGWLWNVEAFPEWAADVFHNIAPVAPEATLSALEAAIARSDTFAKSRYGRGFKTVSLLRSIAYEPEHFARSARLIACLARGAEKSNNTGDAINVFKSLFNIQLSGTHAPIEQRVGLLRELAASGLPEDEQLVTLGLNALLESDHFSSSYGFEFGTRKRDYGYQPRTNEDIQHWYKKTFDFCLELQNSHKNLREKIRDLLATSIGGLARFPQLTNEIIAVANELNNDGGWPEGWVAARRARNIAAQKKNAEAEEKFHDLAARLEPRSLEERIAAYVIPQSYSARDVAEIDFDDEGRYTKAQKQVEENCCLIGEEIAQDVATIRKHLPQLLTSESILLWHTARAIANKCPDLSEAWGAIKQAVPNEVSDTYLKFLTGFAWGVAERDMPVVETMLQDAFENEALSPYFVALQSNQDLTMETNLGRLIQSVQYVRFPTFSYRYLIGGRKCDELSGEQLEALIEAVLQRDDAWEIGLDILGMRIHSFTRSEEHTIGDSERACARMVLGAIGNNVQLTPNHAYKLAKIAEECLRHPDDEILARTMLKHLINRETEAYLYLPDFSDFIRALAVDFPYAVLDELLGIESDVNHAHRLGRLIDDEDRGISPLRAVSADVLMSWIAQGTYERFLKAAQAMPIWEARDDKKILHWTEVALRLMQEASDKVALLNVFLERMRPSFWSGSQADVMATKTRLLDELTHHESGEIAAWAKAALTKFRKDTLEMKKHEEQRERNLDERFE